MRGRLPGWAAAAAAIAVYFAILLPYGATPLIAHPDERHYAYAGLRMVETGDWLVPYTPEHEIRLKKPILPYWFAAAGFRTLGVGVAGFRLFWILAACATLALTYAFARMLGASESASLLALLLTAANPLFFRASVQAIPDMPLTLFMMGAALGFCRILIAPQPAPRGAAWLGWIGIALAVLTKGILPLVFAAFVVAATAFFARERLRPLLAPLPIVFAAALVAAWFAYVVHTHPQEFAAQFFDDQVTGKVGFNPLNVLPRLPAYFAVAIFSVFGLPLVLALAGWRSSPRAPVASWPFAVRLMAAWCLTLPVLFSFGPFVAARYLLPILPIVAVLTVIGFGALRGGPHILGRAAGWIVVAFSVFAVALLGFAGAIEFQLVAYWQSALFIALAAALVAWSLWVARSVAHAPFVLPWSVLLTFGLIFMPLAHLVSPSVAVPVAARLAALPETPVSALAIHQDAEMYVRLLAGKAEPYRALEKADIDTACIVVTNKARLAGHLRARGLSVEAVRGGYEPELKGIFQAVIEGRLAETRREKADKVYFATCKS